MRWAGPRGADASTRSRSVEPVRWPADEACRPTEDSPRRATLPLSGSRRLLAVVALLTVGTLVTFDCLNLLQSDSWADLSRAPHLAAVSQGEDGLDDPPVRQTSSAGWAVPDTVTLFVLWIPCGTGREEPVTRLAAGVRRRSAGRGPPARAVSLPARP